MLDDLGRLQDRDLVATVEFPARLVDPDAAHDRKQAEHQVRRKEREFVAAGESQEQEQDADQQPEPRYAFVDVLRQ